MRTRFLVEVLMSIIAGLAKQIGNWTLFTYSLLTGYRFHDLLDPLELPHYYQHVDEEKFRDKAKASLATAGVFFAFSIAVLAVIIGGGTISLVVTKTVQSISFWMIIYTTISVILPYIPKFGAN